MIYYNFNDIKSAKKNRNDYVDCLKGWGILLVVAGHCSFGLLLWIDPYSFHMPLFFIIAGFYLKHEDSGTFIKKKVKQLLIPYYEYFLYAALLTLFLSYISVYLGPTQAVDILSVRNLVVLPFLNSHNYGIICPLWFVTTLFLAMMGMVIIKNVFLKYTKYLNCSTWIVFAILCLIIEIIARKTPTVVSIYGFGFYLRILMAMCFIMLGSLMYRHREFFWNDKLVVVMSLVFLILVYRYRHTYSFLSMDFSYQGSKKRLFFIIAISGTYFTFGICKLFCMFEIVKKILAWFGVNSFHIMGLHISGFVVLNVILCKSLSIPLTSISSVYYKINWPYDWPYGVYFIFSILFSCLGVVLIKTIKNILNRIFL